MATLIQSKQIEGIVTASVVEGIFAVSGSINVQGPVSASSFVGDGSQLTGIDYSQIDNTPIFRAGTNVTITSGSIGGATAYTINSTGGGGGTSDYTQLINVPGGIISGSAQISALGFVSSSASVPAGTISGSSQVSYTGLSNIPAGIISSSQQLPQGLVSSSIQILGGSGVLSGSHTDISALNAFTASINQKFDTLATQTGSFGGGTTIPAGTISSSAQITALGFVSSSESIPSGTISGSSQLTSSFDSRYTLSGSVQPLPSNLVSGSSQLTSSFDTRYTLSGSVQPLPSNLVSGSSQVSYTGLSNIPAGIISSSQQLPQGIVSGSSQVLNGSGVISGSSQLTASYDERYTLSGSVQNVILPSNLISSSAQITELGFVSGSYATSQSVAELTISSSLMTASIAELREDIDSLASSGVPSGTISGSTQIQRLGYATTGSNQFNGNQSISGSLNVSASVTINGNLTVKGTTTSVSSTTIQLGDNIIELNGRGLQNGGLLVKDEDSPNNASGSLLWDSINDRWIAGPKDGEETILLAGRDGVVSGSSQISFTELNNLPSGIISSSDQLTSSLDGVFATDSDLTTFSSSIATTLESLSQSSGYINYVTNSVEQLTGIEVADFDNNTAVTFTNGVLKFIFGTPTQPSSVAASLSGFATDRFNRVNDTYSVNASWNNQGYTLVSASLYEGATLLTQVGSGTSLTYSTTTSGSHTYQLQYTASSPLDNSLYTTAVTTTGTLSKTNPANPTLSATPSVQLGASSNQIEQGATGSITFTSSSANPSNSWNLTSVTTNVPSPYFVTGSATGSTSISLTATANYASPTGDNSPDLTTTSTATTTYTKIRSLRYGASTTETFTANDLANLAQWDTTLGGSIGTIAKGTTTASGQSVTIAWSGDKFHYIVFDSARANLTNITTSGFGVIGQFGVTTIGQYKVYKTNTLQAGGAGSSITYVLT
jgi:hypothetical protein